MGNEYDDKSITVSDDGIAVRMYYFPFGTKRIRFDRIRSVSRVSMGAVTGRARIWGTASPGLWAHLDLKRPRKQVAFIVKCGGPVSAYLTPEDPAGFEAALSGHCEAPVHHGGRSPFV